MSWKQNLVLTFKGSLQVSRGVIPAWCQVLHKAVSIFSCVDNGSITKNVVTWPGGISDEWSNFSSQNHQGRISSKPDSERQKHFNTLYCELTTWVSYALGLLSEVFWNSTMAQNSTESVPNTTTSSWGSWSSYPLLLDGTPTILLYVCIGAIGIICNSFAIFILTNLPNPKKRITNVLLINQSVLDLFCSVLVLLNAHKSKAIGSLHIVMGLDLYCKVIGSGTFLWGPITSSTWNLVFINAERYLSVVFPVFHKTKLKRKHLKILAAFVWFVGPIFNFIVFVPTTAYSESWNDCAVGAAVPNEAVGSLVGIINLSFTVFIPVGLMTLFYVSMFRSIRKINVKGSNITSTQMKSRNVLKTLAIVTFTFIVCGIPGSISYLLYLTRLINASLLSHPFFRALQCLFLLNISLNPIIYTAQYKDFQDQIKKVFFKRKVGEDSSSGGTANTGMGSMPWQPDVLSHEIGFRFHISHIFRLKHKGA